MNASVPLMAVRHSLDQLSVGQEAMIAAVDVQPELAPRLLALGLTAGRSVRVLRRAPFAGPLHVRVGTTEIMLRRVDAACILLVA